MLSLEWLAGFFDADGCVTICKTKRGSTFRHVLRVEITNCYKPVIGKIQANFPGTVTINRLSDRKRKNKNECGIRDTYQWCIGATKALAFLEAIRPHMEVKGREADIAITFQRHVADHPRNGHRLSDSVLSYRDSLAKQCSAFKKQRYAANS